MRSRDLDHAEHRVYRSWVGLSSFAKPPHCHRKLPWFDEWRRRSEVCKLCKARRALFDLFERKLEHGQHWRRVSAENWRRHRDKVCSSRRGRGRDWSFLVW